MCVVFGKNRFLTAILAVVVVYTVVMAVLSVGRHGALRTQMNDLGNMVQALWGVGEGDLRMTQSNDLDERLRSRIGVHANIIFWPLGLLFKLWPEPEFLLILTSFACGLAGLGIYFFARLHLEDGWPAVIPAVVFLLSPIVHDANLYDFHVTTFVTAFVVWCIWAFDSGRSKLGWLLLIGALICKEDVPFIACLLGGYYFLTGHKHRGLLIMGVSILYLIFIFVFLIPLMNEGKMLPIVGHDRYGWLGDSPAAVLNTFVTQPHLILKNAFKPDHVRLPIYLLLVGGIAAFKAWRLLIVAIPPVAAGLLASSSWMTQISGTYYWITPFAIIVLACVLSAKKQTPGSQAARIGWQLKYLSIATVVFSVALSPLPYGLNAAGSEYVKTEDLPLIGELHRLIPKEAKLCVQNNLGAHFAKRRDVAVFPRRISTAEYLLFRLRYDRGSDSSFFPTAAPYTLFQMHAPEFVDAMRKKLDDPDWGLVFQKQSLFLFKRGTGWSVDKSAADSIFEGKAAEFLATVQSRHQFRTPTLFVGAVMFAALLSTCTAWKVIDMLRRDRTTPRTEHRIAQ
jgi:uncharacterized membrane protein